MKRLNDTIEYVRIPRDIDNGIESSGLCALAEGLV